MATCNGCGGVVGRDCYNPQECEWIARDQQRIAFEGSMRSDREIEELWRVIHSLTQKVSRLEQRMGPDA